MADTEIMKTASSSTESDPRVFQLSCACQPYPWGKLGRTSAVAQLMAHGNPSFKVDDNQTYAELWMGTHPKGPSMNQQTGETLSNWIARHPEALGKKVQDRFHISDQLPFLFKVLSVNKSLSIQAHPSKAHAEVLHAEKPDKYPDSNHKPEMAIALTPFEGLCGFRPKQEIVGFLRNVPELRSVVGADNAAAFEISDGDDVKDKLRICFSALMNAPADIVKEHVIKLVRRMNEADARGVNTSSSLGELLLRLNSQFPGDCGCFCIYFLNHLILEPGQAMFLEANLPHAYLSGDCLECMACSDNVVRAGLTPKFKDVAILCSMLTYTCKPASDNLFPSQPDPDDPCVTLYHPPIPDFAVAKIQISAGAGTYSLSALPAPSIILVISGAASISGDNCPDTHLNRGSVLFIAAQQKLHVTVESEDVLMFRAYCHT